MRVVVTDLEEFDAGEDAHVIDAAKNRAHCRGCFGCWTKTPGQCVIHDDIEQSGAWIGQAEELVLVARCCYGSLGPSVKRVMDRSISYIHPYFDIRDGWMRHKRRYDNRLRICAFLYGAAGPKEERTMQGILAANAAILDAELADVRFFPSPADLLQEISL